jgi:hypothetical protein
MDLQENHPQVIFKVYANKKNLVMGRFRTCTGMVLVQGIDLNSVAIMVHFGQDEVDMDLGGNHPKRILKACSDEKQRVVQQVSNSHSP